MSETVVSLFCEQARRHGGRTALRTLRAGGAAADGALSWGAWADAARQFAAALAADGHAPGEAAAVLASNGLLWPVAEMGIVSAGLVSVGVYPTSAPAQVRQVLADCGASAVFVDSAEQLAKVLAVRAALPRLRRIVVGEVTPGSARPTAAAAGPGVLRLEEWLALGAATLPDPAIAAELERRAAALRPADTAVLIYTSGSTGEPKGAQLSHRYLLASAASVRDTLGLTPNDSALSFLPFCHAAERVFGLYTRLLCGMEAALVPDHARLWDAAQAYSPTLFGGLPRFYEKAYEALQARRAGANAAERERWEHTLAAGRLRSRLRRGGAEVPAALERRWREAGAPFFEEIRAHFGARMRLATSGGATLPAAVAEFLDALGLTVLGAYGLTEHLCVAFNRPDRYDFDGVGPAMPGTELRIADDGEILVHRSALTFSGYLNRPADTAAAFTEDGDWLRTGDLGSLDPRGFLRVTGRKKELIALSTGKKVAPLPIEARLQEDPWIAHAMLYGEGKKFVSALICLRRPVLEAWARESDGALPRDYAELVRHPAVRARVQAAVDRVNAGLSRPEQIRSLVLLEHELAPEADELTPTLKLRRAVVAERYRELLEALYR